MDSVARSTAIDDLAKMDAHSAGTVRSVPYDVSDMIDGGVMKKSVRAFLSVMKRLPLIFLLTPLIVTNLITFWLIAGREKASGGGYCRRRLCCVGPKGSACKTEAALAQRAHEGHGGSNPGVH